MKHGLLGKTTLILCLVSLTGYAATLDISGERKQWHKVTFDFAGPQASETGSVNPFYDYRLDMTCVAEDGRSYRVPGYFAADGDAANTGATGGNRWRVHFTPDVTGTWVYQVHFRTGKDIATTLFEEQPQAGTAVPGLDGLQGTFTVTSSDKTGVDFRNPANGRLVFNGNRYLKFSGSERYYLKAGQGSPETFLAYTDFDDVRDLKGNFLHRYAVHAAHYDDSAASFTWRNRKGRNILGAVNYLAQQGVNSQYVILTTVEGDGCDTWPWVQPDQVTRYDCSRLDQWDRVFTYMNNRGLLLTCLLFECENEQLLDDGAALGSERKVYMREMVARFAHLPGVVWIMSEETRLKSQFPPDFNRQRLQRMRALDPYDHACGLHNGAIDGMDYADCPTFDYFSLHASCDNWSQAHAKALYRVNEAKRRGHPWMVFFDECVSAQVGVKTDADDPDHDPPRKHGLWGSLLAGAGGVSWYYGYSQPHADLNCDDFTLREKMFQQTRYAVDFFQENRIPFWEMENRNDLVDSGRCLAKEGEVYVIQLEGPTYANLYLSEARDYELRWFDPKTGGKLQRGTSSRVQGPGTKSVGRPPGDPSHDWILLVRPRGAQAQIEEKTLTTTDQNGLIFIEAEDLPLAEGWVVDSQASGYSGRGYLLWQGGTYHQNPGHGVMEVTLKVTTPGTYRFQWRNRVGAGDNPTEANDSWLRFPNASNVYGEKRKGAGLSRVYPRGLGKSPEPEGAGADGWFKVYSSRTMDWSWGSYVSDNDVHPVFVEFDEPGEYTLQIAGRSPGHALDCLTLYHASISEEDATSLRHSP